MSWQEDLAELDRTLAEGRISADDYRRRRDELLAAASGGGPAAPAPANTNSGPFAPPVRWDAVPPSSQQNQNPDATQIVKPGAQQANPDKTQVVSQRPADADRTQYVAPVTPPPNQMPPQQGGWQSAPPSSSPPWGGDSYSPIGDANPSWIAQGPEVFDDSGGGKGKIIGIVVAVVLLAGIAFGAYMIWGRDGSTPSADATSQTSAPPTTTTSAPPPDPLPVGEVPGKVSTNKAVKDFSAVPGLKYLLDSESALYTTAGASKAKLAQFTLEDNVTKGIVLIVQCTDATAAAAGALGLHNTQINNGMTQVTDGPAGVMAGQIDAKDGQNARVRGHYSSRDLIVRVDVAAPTLAAARKAFDEALEAELKVLPADG